MNDLEPQERAILESLKRRGSGPSRLLVADASLENPQELLSFTGRLERCGWIVAHEVKGCLWPEFAITASGRKV